MSARTFDVAIIGGGPAGCATALSLKTHAPSLSIVVIEASRYDALRIGETLPPAARPLLEHLGVWDAFHAQAHRVVHGTAAAWGAPLPLDNDFVFMARGPGWHLDRAAFDSMLARESESRGVALLRDARVQDVEHDAHGWQLSIGSTVLSARFLVDAAGSAARFARRCGANVVAADHLLGFARFFTHDTPGDGRTVVEAFADGWWYTAGLPDGRRVAACMTDADLARSMRLAEVEVWDRMLESMPVMGAVMRDAHPCSTIVVRPSESHHLDVAAGEDWLAAGDAASTFDPLSSQGILKALREGIFASYAIGDRLTRGDDAGLRRYRQFIRAEFDSYRETRTKYYREEQRWPSNEFWRRRHSA